jgi:hypothetical protein
MASPREIAEAILCKPQAERLDAVTKVLEMVQAAISIRSVCRDKHFISMHGGEDCGTKFDRLLKELFGMGWVDPKPKVRRKRKSEDSTHASK